MNFSNETFNITLSADLWNVELNVSNLFLAAYLIIFNLLVVLGNILVILAICIDFHLRSPTHHLLGSLAIADLLLGTTVLPFSSFQLYFDYWPLGSVFCDIWLATDVLYCTASIYLVLVVSIDRLIGVTKPLRYHMIVTKRKMYLTIASVWIVSLLVSLMGAFWKDSKISHEPSRLCQVNQNVVYALVSASISFYIPLTFILIIYYQIYKAARAQMKFMSTGIKTSKDVKDTNGNGITLRVHVGPSNSKKKKKACICNINNNGRNSFNQDDVALQKLQTNPNLIISKSYDDSLDFKSKQKLPMLKEKKCKCHKSCNNLSKGISTSNLNMNITSKLIKFKHEKKAAKTLAIVVGCLILCWAPFFLLLPFEAICKTCQIPSGLFTFFFWLGYCNSAMNPLIYAFSSREFRKAYKGILKCDVHYRKKNRKEIEKYSKNRLKSKIQANKQTTNSL